MPLNPVDGVEPPHVPAKGRDFLTAEESERLVAALIDTEYELPILVGLYCGLRPTEYLAMRWRALDLDGVLRVTQNVHPIRLDEATEHMGQQVYGIRFGPAKTHRSKHPVSMPALVVELLRAHRSQQASPRLQAGAVWTDLDLVFTDARGYPCGGRSTRRWTRPACGRWSSTRCGTRWPHWSCTRRRTSSWWPRGSATRTRCWYCGRTATCCRAWTGRRRLGLATW